MSLLFGANATDVVDCGSGSSIDDLMPWTWLSWVYMTTFTGGRYIMGKEDTSSPFGGRRVQLNSTHQTGGLRVTQTRSTTGADYRTSSLPLSTNTWQLVAVTCDIGAAAGEVFNVYVGSLTSLAAECTYGTTTDGSGTQVSESAGILRIGNNNPGTTVFQGRIGPSAQFNRALSLSEIHQWQQEVQALDGCVGLWLWGDNGTGTQTDYSGYGNSGTVTGATRADDPPLLRPWGRRALSVPYTAAAPTGYTLTANGAALTLTGSPATLTVTPTIVLDPATTYQTMRGWEVTSQAGDQEANASLYLDQVIELGAQYGVDTVRLEIKDEWETSDGVYDWSFWDSHVPDFVLPFKEALARHGRTMRLNLCYVAFGTHSGLHTTAANYADFMLAGVQYLDTTFGLVPDTIEVILEPDNTNGAGVHMNTGAEIGAAVKALGDLLALNGYTPGFIVPSALSMAAAPTLYDSTKAVSGAAAYITGLSYHRYSGVSDSNLAAILSRVTADGVESGMLEWITANAETLWADVTKANASLWQQYTLAFPTSDDGAQLFPIVSNVPTIGSRTHGLAQYFKHVRRGAERIATSSITTNVRPVAFINPDGRYAVVIHADATGTYTVGPVPTGSYYVTRSSTTAARTPIGMVTVGGDGIATLSLNSGDIATLAPIEGAAGGRLRLTGGTANLTVGGGGAFTPRGLWFTR